MTKIAWTDATWNPVTGCSHVSEGCRHCYAETLSLRRGWSKKPWTAQNVAENVVLHPERLKQPLTWRKPRRVFVNSMSDLFHEEIPDRFLLKVFTVMGQSITWAKGDRHVFQVLTKRAERMREFMQRLRWKWGTPDGGPWRMHETDNRPLNPVATFDLSYSSEPLPNIWLGVSCEDQKTADERIPILLDTAAAVRFVSCEPLLGPINLHEWSQDGVPSTSQIDGPHGMHYIRHGTPRLDWIIVGGESGPNYRQMIVAWVEAIAAQCRDAGVPLFVKQDSGPRPGKQGLIPDDLWRRKEFPA